MISNAHAYHIGGFKIGDRVRIHKQPECRNCQDTLCDGLTGTVEDIDLEVDNADPGWTGAYPDPALDVRGHYYWVKTDRPIPYTGVPTGLLKMLGGVNYFEDGNYFAATELELLDEGDVQNEPQRDRGV